MAAWSIDRGSTYSGFSPARRPLSFLFCFQVTKEAADGAAAKHQVRADMISEQKKRGAGVVKAQHASQHATAGTKLLGPDRESRQTGAHMHAPPWPCMAHIQLDDRSQRQIPSLHRTEDSDHTSDISHLHCRSLQGNVNWYQLLQINSSTRRLLIISSSCCRHA